MLSSTSSTESTSDSPSTPYASSWYSTPFSSFSTESAESSTTCYRQECHGVYGRPVTCRCDRRCFFFGDCCFGIRVPPPRFLGFLRFDTTVWECVRDTFLPLLYPELNHGYRMVTRCPQSWSADDVRSKCEAVSGNETDHILYVNGDDYYRSIPCAICNGIDESSLSPVYGSDQCIWRSKDELKCLLEPNSSSPIIDNEPDNSTVVELYQDIPSPRFCLFGVEETCPSKNESAEWQNACQMLYVPLVFNQSVHKNPYCAVCNNHDIDSHCNILLPSRGRSEQVFNVGIGAVFSGIVNKGKTDDEEDAIKDTQIYGRSLSVTSLWPLCKSVQRRLLYENGNVVCYKNESCSMNSNISVVDTRDSSPGSEFEERIRDALASNMDFADIPSLVVFLQLLRNRSDEHIPDGLTVQKWCHHVKYNQEPLSNSDCTNEWYVGQPDEFLPFVMSNESYIFVNGSFVKPIWWRNQTDLWFDNIDWITYHQMYLCGVAQEIQFCPSITVTADSVEWVVHFNETVLKYKNRIYFREEFFVQPDGRILICIDEDSQKLIYTALDIAGNVAFAVSSACLLVTLLTYLIFSELQNRQGIVVINFLVALLLGQIMLQFVGHHFSERTIPCLTAASLSHFFFLSSFVWTTVLAWDLRRSLSASSTSVISKTGKSRCKIVMYALIGWGIPLVIACTTLLVQLGGFSDEPILAYGGPACWFATRLSSLAVFFGPICVCLVTNCFLFFGTMWNLHSTNKSTAIVRKSSDNATRDQLTLELRISVKVRNMDFMLWKLFIKVMIKEEKDTCIRFASIDAIIRID